MKRSENENCGKWLRPCHYSDVSARLWTIRKERSRSVFCQASSYLAGEAKDRFGRHRFKQRATEGSSLVLQHADKEAVYSVIHRGRLCNAAEDVRRPLDYQTHRNQEPVPVPKAMRLKKRALTCLLACSRRLPSRRGALRQASRKGAATSAPALSLNARSVLQPGARIAGWAC